MKIGKQYNFYGDIVTLIKVFVFNPRLPYNCRVQYSNGHCTDVMRHELMLVE